MRLAARQHRAVALPALLAIVPKKVQPAVAPGRTIRDWAVRFLRAFGDGRQGIGATTDEGEGSQLLDQPAAATARAPRPTIVISCSRHELVEAIAFTAQVLVDRQGRTLPPGFRLQTRYNTSASASRRQSTQAAAGSGPGRHEHNARQVHPAAQRPHFGPGREGRTGVVLNSHDVGDDC